MLEKIKSYITHSMGVYTLVFTIVSLVSWYKNGTEGTHYDIKQLIDIYTFIIMQLTAKYGLDSWLNSVKGSKPD